MGGMLAALADAATGKNELDFAAVWTAAGVVTGFSVTALIFRIGREASQREKGGRYWFPRADYLLMSSLVVALIGVFVVPILGAGFEFAKYSLGAALLLLAAYPIALVAHYELLFGEVTAKARARIAAKGDVEPYPPQEQRVIAGTLVTLAAYVVVVTIQIID